MECERGREKESEKWRKVCEREGEEVRDGSRSVKEREKE